MTNFIPTDQSRSSCEESSSLSEAKCTEDSHCQNKPFTSFANGRWTGRCLLSSKLRNFSETENITQQPTGLCEIQGKIILKQSVIKITNIELCSQGIKINKQ